MLRTCLGKRTSRHMLYGGLLSLVFFCISMVGWTPAFGQLSVIPPYFQSLVPTFSNSIYGAPSFSNVINPYASIYNPFSLYSGFNSFSRTAYYPQARVAGSLIPFGSPFASSYANPFVSSFSSPFASSFANSFVNPFANPYTAAAFYYAAAVPADVSGTWAGTWTSSFLAGGVITGELSMTLAQADSDVTGTAVFLLNKILKYGAYVVGTVDGNVLTINSTVTTSVTGTMIYDVTMVATVNGTTMEGTYEVINLSTALISEQGTFVANRL
ncbi:MAG: hypothetical protein ACMUIL_04690 [bacterium]